MRGWTEAQRQGDWQGDFTDNSNTSLAPFKSKSYKSHPHKIALFHPRLSNCAKKHTPIAQTLFSFDTIENFNDKIVHNSITCVPTLQNRPLYASTRWELFNDKKRDRWRAPWYQGCVMRRTLVEHGEGRPGLRDLNLTNKLPSSIDRLRNLWDFILFYFILLLLFPISLFFTQPLQKTHQNKNCTRPLHKTQKKFVMFCRKMFTFCNRKIMHYGMVNPCPLYRVLKMLGELVRV
jgi:hypothetical protein